MKKETVIGIDIGGTHTDLVLIDNQNRLMTKLKTFTTDDLVTGVKTGLEKILSLNPEYKETIHRICIGTTHATNAILEANQLYKVGVIRLAGHYPTSIMPCFGWPKHLREAVYVDCITIDGGYECDSREIRPYNKKQAIDAAQKLLDLGVESFAIVGTFSPLKYDQEIECSNDILEAIGEKYPLSLSHKIGGCGFIERENATILNASLKKAMQQGFEALEIGCRQIGLTCPVFVTQNDGSLINLCQAIESPLLTISSGPTNSFVGAGKMTGIDDAIVVDIGGTSTDIGIVRNGFPRRSMISAQIGGVALNFPMPDVMALSIGGGSYVNLDSGNLVGPRSCGKNLMREAKVFGGKNLTLTDIAVKYGCFDLGDLSNVDISNDEVKRVMQYVEEQVTNKIMKMKGKNSDLPVIVVGGGARICKSEGLSYMIPENGDVANAYGAALAEIAGSVDTVVSLSQRDKTLDALKSQAMEMAINKGAQKESVRVVDIQVIPYHYMPNQLARVTVKASGVAVVGC